MSRLLGRPLFAALTDDTPVTALPNDETAPGKDRRKVDWNVPAPAAGDGAPGVAGLALPGSTERRTAGMAPILAPTLSSEKGPLLEPSPYSGNSRAALPADATEREKALQNIRDLQGTERPREKSIWKRLGSGISDGLQTWAANGGQGGILGALGAMGAGAGIFAASPGSQAEFQKKQQLGRLFGQYQQAMGVENAEAERQAAMLKAQGIGLDNTNKALEGSSKKLDMLHKTYGPLMRQLQDQDYTPKEIADVLTAKGIPMIEQDVRQWDTIYNSRGEALVVPKKGAPVPIAAPGMPINYDAVRQPVTVTDPNGGKVTATVSGNKALDTAVRAQETGARMAEARANRERMQSNADREFALSQQRFNLSVQQEERIKEEAKQKYAGKDAATLEKRTADLDKAREAVEALRAEAAKLGNVSEGVESSKYGSSSEEERDKALKEIAEKERRALAQYEVILKRMQDGN